MGDERADILISRVIDGEASRAEYDELRELAAVSPSVWRDLAESQHLARSAEAEFERVAQVAEGVEAPVEEHRSLAIHRRFARAMAVGGWVAAAAITLAWTIGGGPDTSIQTLPGSTASVEAGLVPVSTASAALDRYLELGKKEGQVLGEMPTGVVLERQPSPDGRGYEVIFLRQIVERAVVEDVYELARSEGGEAVPIRVATPRTAGVH